MSDLTDAARQRAIRHHALHVADEAAALTKPGIPIDAATVQRAGQRVAVKAAIEVARLERRHLTVFLLNRLLGRL